jgi:hypothetical protein
MIQFLISDFRLSGGERLRIGKGADAATLGLVLDALRR